MLEPSRDIDLLRSLHRQLEPIFTEQLKTGIGHLGVIDPATACLDFGQRLLNAPRSSLGAMRCHRLDNIRDGQNPSLHQDLLALEPLPIAAAIHPFVALMNHLSGRH